MKKLFLAVLFSLLVVTVLNFSENSHALTKRVIKFGILSKLNSTEKQFADTWKKTYAPNNEYLEVTVKFYDTLTALQMALNSGEINQMILPDSTAQYVTNQTKEYEPVLVLHSKGMGLSFGFRQDSESLRNDFNAALSQLKDNLTLPAIEGMYISSSGFLDPEPVKFANFEGAETINVAVTGDLPPIDYIAPDGTPAGFNTAVLAEVAKILRKNIKLVNIETGARTFALASDRVDVAFWYEVEKGAKIQSDIPEGVIVSEPYYEWEKFIHLKKSSGTKTKSSSSQNWDINLSFWDLLFPSI